MKTNDFYLYRWDPLEDYDKEDDGEEPFHWTPARPKK